MREIKGIEELMEDLLEEEGTPELSALLRIRKGWERIAGERLGRRTVPYRLEEGTLYVGADSHATAQDLHYLEEKIKKAAGEISNMTIKRVKTKKINLK
ncbi:MAG: DUF721 domain-containing protein [Actinobacteria bacterium]|nr:DUF721 domain-containing protein [Actinomycetota bacterium]